MAALDPSDRLCPCGVRGCEQYELHTAAWIVPARCRLRHRIARKPRRRRTT